MNGTIRALGTWTIDHSSSNARDPRARPAEPLYRGYLSDTDRARARSSSVHLHTVNGGWRTVVRNSLFRSDTFLWMMFIFLSLSLFRWPRVTLWLWPLRDIYVGRCDRVLRLESLLGTPTATRHLALRDEVSAIARTKPRTSGPRSHSGRKVESAWVWPKCPTAPGPTPMCKRIAGSRYSCSAVACRPIIRFRDLHVHASPGGVSTGRTVK